MYNQYGLLEELPSGNSYSVSVAEAGSAADTPATHAVLPSAVAETGSAADTPADLAIYRSTVTETGAATDAENSLIVSVNAVAEAGSAADTPSDLAIYPSTVTETGAATDFTYEPADGIYPVVTEVGGAADTVNSLIVFANTVAEAGDAVDTSFQTSGGIYALSVAEAGSAIDAEDTPDSNLNNAVTEAGSAADTVSDLAIYLSTVTETGAATDTPSDLVVYPSTVAEVGSAADTVSDLAVYPSTVAEVGSAADTVSDLAVYPSAVAEAGSAADTPSDLAIYPSTVTETGAATDTVNSQGVSTSTIAETGSAADAETTLGVFGVAVAEAGSATDTASEVAVESSLVTEAGSAADTVSDLAIYPSTFTEAGSAADTVSDLAIYPSTVTETGAAADTSSIVDRLFLSVAEAGSATDTLEVSACIQVPIAAVSIAEFAPLIDAGVDDLVALTAVVVAVPLPSIDAGAQIVLPALIAAVSVAIFAPTIHVGAEITPSTAVAVTVAKLAPGAEAGVAIYPSTVAVTVAKPTPAITASLNIVVGATAIAAVGFAPSIDAGAFVGVGTTVESSTSTSLDENGWTIFTPTAPVLEGYNATNPGTNIIYVSSSTGSDDGTIGTFDAPIKTLAYGLTGIRSGYPDWLLLKKGDTWTDEDLGYLWQSGQSATAPIVIGSYDPSQPGICNPYTAGPRPIVEPNSSGSGAAVRSQGGAGAGGDYLAITGIDFYNYAADPGNSGFTGSNDVTGLGPLLNPINWMLIEDCRFRFFGINVYINGSLNSSNNNNVTIRRNVIVDAYSTTTGSDGLLITATNNLVLDENIIDHNGWNATVSGAGASPLNHNAYLQYDPGGGSGGNGPLTVNGNIFSNDASGSQFRSGGTITNNAFIRNPYGHNLGQPFSGDQSLVSQNVHIEQLDNTVNGGSSLSDWSFNTFSSYNGNSYNLGTATISDNIFAHSSTPNTNAGAIDIDSGQTGTVVSNNIACDWKANSGNPLVFDEDSSTLSGNYEYVADANHGSFSDPNRSVGSFYATLSGATANATFTGVIIDGVLTVSDITGTLNLQDAITWVGQTTADFIKSFGTATGGNGTYNLAGTESVSSTSMSSYTTEQFITAAREQSKANWNANLTAAAFNTYIAGGFGLSWVSVSGVAIFAVSVGQFPPGIDGGAYIDPGYKGVVVDLKIAEIDSHSRRTVVLSIAS